MDQLDGSDQLLRSASFLYLKPWLINIFKDGPFSLYMVAASESAEGLVFKIASPTYPFLQNGQNSH